MDDHVISRVAKNAWTNGWWWGFTTAFVSCNLTYLLLSILFGWK